jgi:hypothetical protein
MLFLSMFILNMSHDDETLPNVIKRKLAKKGREKEKQGARKVQDPLST